MISVERMPCPLHHCNLKDLPFTRHKLDIPKISFFFSLKICSVFDWIQIIVAVVGVLRNTMEPSHNTVPFEDNITKNEHSALYFVIYVWAVFQKEHLETPKGIMETKCYGSQEV